MLVFKLVAPELVEKCQDYRLLNYYQYMQCFGGVYNRFTDAERDNFDHPDPNMGLGPFGLPIKIFMPLEGFFRQYEGPLHREHPEKIEHHLVPSDLFVHGYKRIGTLFGSNNSVYHCNGSFFEQSAQEKPVKIPEGLMPLRLGEPGMWWNDTELLDFAKECCLVRFPGCFKG